MAAFYLLPPRESLNEAIGQVLGRLLPGLSLPSETWETVVESLASSTRWPADVFLIPRDDLPDGESIDEALFRAYGAEPGDDVIEVGLPPKPPRTRVLSTGVYEIAGAR